MYARMSADAHVFSVLVATSERMRTGKQCGIRPCLHVWRQRQTDMAAGKRDPLRLKLTNNVCNHPLIRSRYAGVSRIRRQHLMPEAFPAASTCSHKSAIRCATSQSSSMHLNARSQRRNCDPAIVAGTSVLKLLHRKTSCRSRCRTKSQRLPLNIHRGIKPSRIRRAFDSYRPPHAYVTPFRHRGNLW